MYHQNQHLNDYEIVQEVNYKKQKKKANKPTERETQGWKDNTGTKKEIQMTDNNETEERTFDMQIQHDETEE